MRLRRSVATGCCKQLSGDLVEVDRAWLSRVTSTLCSISIRLLGKKDVVLIGEGHLP